jgi:hypothetical protein
MAISKIEYNDLIRSVGKIVLQPQTIRAHIPEPTYTDFRKGYIVRYFIQRINDDSALIYEVNETDYLKFSLDPFYTAVNIDWRLTGSYQIIEESNSKSVKFGSKKMKSLIFYLPNYLQLTGY